MQKKTEPLSSASLRARAIAALARREHSRQELFQKFSSSAESPESLEAVLDALEQEGLLSDHRFAESVARTRGARYGLARVKKELQQKGVSGTVASTTLEGLKLTEADRLRQVWEKKFGLPPETLEEAGRQQRFLLQRGFSAAAISQLLRSQKGR
ncbi:MAG: recombination regulator RecX [Burkholderiaceae bacterium]|nr:recombination regulator RecX [Burkholderiaceae bacterium]